MAEEKILALVAYLKTLGFENPGFKEKIRHAFENNFQRFDLDHSVSFGKEAIKFNLVFLWDFQFESFKLTSYLAAYTSSPDSEMICAEYGPHAKGVHNINQVFHDLSGLFEDLYNKVRILRLEYFPGIDIYTVLWEHLASNPDSFEIRCSTNDRDGYFECIVPVEKLDGRYSLNTYTATLVPYPPIEHEIINGIDTLVLECEMSRINWRNRREVYMFQDGYTTELKLNVLEIIDKINRLNADPRGALVAALLKLKFWKDVPQFREALGGSVISYFENLPKRELVFSNDFSAEIAFNALCGRAFFREKVDPLSIDKSEWRRFDFTKKDYQGKYACNVIGGLDRKGIAKLLSNLSLSSECIYLTTIDLLKGERTWVMFPGEKKIFFEANPEHKTVNVYSEMMEPILVNFFLDPKWTPLQNQEETTQKLMETERKPVKKRRTVSDNSGGQKRKK